MPQRRNVLHPPLPRNKRQTPLHPRSPHNQLAHPQRRLTAIWQLPPPYIADRPIPAVAARTQQQALTAFFPCTPAAQPVPLPTAAAAPCHTPAPAVLTTPRLREVHTSRRRAHVLTPPPAGTRGTITHYYPNRVYTPHVAANPANYTPDHDPDKQ